MITIPAIRKNGEIFTGYTHAQIMNNNAISYIKDKFEEGFLTDKDVFVNRREAAEIAYNCKQIDKEICELKSYHIKWKETK